ncbi:nucleotide-binding universal stress UspA family protein [Pontibacter ummariensis]|uniref:Nucleotide-binding universal stress protein, UspA family n=1 Tax=Pontibacter ummariensis TaxID=1610492 RepID=A0A239DEY1_9BACT|nr:universal stress protein [Pontibacter ummariensis]PRY14373.1 nucleotide-binding universal stress UspA family protein [Pontibacter ummariensis]SNS30428.1 Nucleotide-binding universal stress protein, UspA family [Pontibacter ummariensis]
MLKILALSDFSANAHFALRAAMQLAQRYGGEVIFAHAMDKPLVPATAPQELFTELLALDQAKWQEKLRKEVQQLFQMLHIRHKEVMYQVKIVAGPLPQAAIQLSEEHNIELQVMGNSGASGLEHFLLGSNSLQLIKSTTKPLLVVPKGFMFEGFTNITLIIRPEKFRYRAGIGILLRLARSYRSVLHFLFVSDEEKSKRALEEFLRKHQLWQEPQEYSILLHTVPNTNRIEALKEHMDAIKPDLLVVFPSSESIWEELFSDSITEEVADQGKVPLLVFPEANS